MITMTQSAELNIQVAAPKVNFFHNFLTLWKILNNLAQIITIVRLCAYGMHDTTSRPLLVKGEEAQIRVHR
jgi:hypothetical protein